MLKQTQKAEATDTFLPLSLRPGFLVRRLNQIHSAIFYNECEDFNITPVQYGMLSTLLRSPGLDQKTLGYEVGLDRANTGDVLKRLESRKLIKRKPCESDRRTKNAFLTEAGEQITRAMYAKMLRAQELLVSPLSAKELEQFMELLHTLVNANNGLARTTMNMR